MMSSVRTKEELEAFLLEKAREIHDAAFNDGYQHGLLMFNSELQRMSPAERATHVKGTEAPENESLLEMQKREGWRWPK